MFFPMFVSMLVVITSALVRDPGQCYFNQRTHFLNCSSKELSSVPTEEFPLDVKGIDLSANAIHVIENLTFINTSGLQYLDLSYNKFIHLKPLAFEGLRNLLYLNLSKLYFIRGIPQMFKPLVNLKVIRMGMLRIPDIDRFLGTLTNVTKLFLEITRRDFVFGEGFKALTKLNTIIGSQGRGSQGCYFGVIRNTSFEVFRNIPVKELRLVDCHVTAITEDAFDALTSLEVLDLSYNDQLGVIPALLSLQGLQGNIMREINLVNVEDHKQSKFQGLSSTHFKPMSNVCVTSLDLSQNYIWFMEEPNEPFKLRFDCVENIIISHHSQSTLPTKFLSSIHVSNRLKYLDFSSCEYCATNSKDPNEVTSALAGKKVTLPLAPSLLWLNISGCREWFKVKDTTNFSFPSNLRFLYAADLGPLNYSSLLQGLQNLTHVDMSHNKLIDLPPRTFDTNGNLTALDLSNNRLQRMPRALWGIPRLQQLDLSSNAFTHLTVVEMRLLESWMEKADDRNKFRLILRDNLFQCTCDTVLFMRWITVRKRHLDHHNEYPCFLSNGTLTSVQKFEADLTSFEVQCISHTYLVISVVGSLLSLLLILVLAGIYRYRLNLRFWLYTKLHPPEEMFANHEYNYDVFVAYTSDDRDWVVNELRRNIEPEDGPIRLCIHDRDFTFGKPIHMNIVEKMAESRKIMLIISPDFLTSTYGPLEIEYAGMKCLEEGRDDIILCVLMEEIPARQMPRALRNLWHKITFLKWSADPQEQVIFWRNLKAVVGPANA